VYKAVMYVHGGSCFLGVVVTGSPVPLQPTAESRQ